jgi:hypothetical protein
MSSNIESAKTDSTKVKTQDTSATAPSDKMLRLNAFLANGSSDDAVLLGEEMLGDGTLCEGDRALVSLAVAKGYRSIESGCDPRTQQDYAQKYHAWAIKYLSLALEHPHESLSFLCESLKLAQTLGDATLSARAKAGLRKIFGTDMTSKKDPSELLQSATIAFSLGLQVEAVQILARIVEVHPKDSKEAIKALNDVITAGTKEGELTQGLSKLRKVISSFAVDDYRVAFALLEKLIREEANEGAPINPLNIFLARVAAYEAQAEILYAELLSRLAADKKINLQDEALQPVVLSLNDLLATLEDMNRTEQSGAVRSKFHEHTRTHHTKPINGTAANALKGD